MFNSSIIGTFDTIEDATFGIEEFCATETAAKAFDGSYDSFVDSADETEFDSFITF